MKTLNSLPIIDMQAYVSNYQSRHIVARQIREVCKEIGFFYIQNHGIPLELQKSILANSQKFFDLPKGEKNKIHMSKSGLRWRGYYSVG